MLHHTRTAVVALATALVLGACMENPAGPDVTGGYDPVVRQQKGKPANGTGLVLDALTGVGAPLIGELGTVTIDQAIIAELAVVEDLAGNIIGVSAEGVLELSGGALGDEVVTQDFTGRVQVLSSGAGQCDIVTIDLGPVAVDALGDAVFVDAPEASVTPRASGALGPLLCNLGSLLDAPTGLVTSGVRGIVNAINRLII